MKLILKLSIIMQKQNKIKLDQNKNVENPVKNIK